MNILICSDSFKGSLSSREVSSIISHIFAKKFPNAEINSVEIADGGEGSLDSLKALNRFKVIAHESMDSLLRPVEAEFLFCPNSKKIIIELAQTCGLSILQHSDRNCFNTTTYGVGLQILKAMEYKPSSIDLLIGGSATNDLGLGMVAAVSNRFFNSHTELNYPRGRDMISMTRIGSPYRYLDDIEFNVVTDVNNKLVGPHGATYTYGKQKGASKDELDQLEAGAKNIVDLVKQFDSNDHHLREGAGAAGGVGYGAMVFFGANKILGIDYMMELLDMRKKILEADIIITGEGRIDHQTKNGKLISGISKMAHAEGKKVLAVCALNELDENEIMQLKLDAIYPLYEKAPDQISKTESERRLQNISHQIIIDHLS